RHRARGESRGNRDSLRRGCDSPARTPEAGQRPRQGRAVCRRVGDSRHIVAGMSAPNTGAAVRAEAARVIDAVANTGRSLDDALASADAALDPADRPLLRMLCYGTLRNHWRLREFIGQLLEKPLKTSDCVIESLIALGLFQLL